MLKLNQKLNFPSSTEADAAVFDIEHFSSQTFGERVLQEEILQLFLTQIEDLEHRFLGEGAAASWRYLAHTLKGAAAAVGATALMRLAERWEDEPAPADPLQWQSVRDEFNTCCDAFRMAVQAFLA